MYRIQKTHLDNSHTSCMSLRYSCDLNHYAKKCDIEFDYRVHFRLWRKEDPEASLTKTSLRIKLIKY